MISGSVASWLKSHYTEWGCIFLVSSIIVARQFTSSGFASCVLDDSILHMSWVRQFAEVLGEGVWLPRWLPDSNGGYGSPVFVFYSPLVYYVTAVAYWVTGSVILAMKLTRSMGLFLSGLAMFSYADKLAGRKTALVASLVYLAVPFHVLDVSYWTLYAEPWAWFWFPLILLFLRRVIDGEDSNRSSIAGFAVCYAGLILTHLVSAYMFSFVIAGYVLFCGKEPKLRVLIQVALAVALGLALAAFFLFPAYYERKFVHIDYITLLPEFDFRNTFLFFPNPEFTPADSFQAKTIGLLQVISLLQATWAAAGLTLILSMRDLSFFLRREVWFATGVALSCLLLMSFLSTWIWDLIPGLAKIQFSTRWLSIYTWAAALIIGVSFQNWRLHKAGVLRWVNLAHFGSALLASLSTLIIIFSGCFLDQEHTQLALANVHNAPEYNPLVMPNWRQRTIVRQDPSVTVMQGQAQVETKRWDAQNRNLRVSAETPVSIRIRLFDYPGWSVMVDDLRVEPRKDSKTGAMILDVDEGLHEIRIQFGNTWWRKIATGISLIAVTTLLGITIKSFWKC